MVRLTHPKGTIGLVPGSTLAQRMPRATTKEPYYTVRRYLAYLEKAKDS